MGKVGSFQEQLKVVATLVREVIPAVDRELDSFRRQLEDFENVKLADLALSSLTYKRFHALGGSVFAISAHEARKDQVLKLIVTFQTISDYLDNLCDRAGVLDEKAFRQLHLSMLDAVSLSGPSHDYYKYFPCSGDGGYLNRLVEKCCMCISELPGYRKVQNHIAHLTELYCDLQAHKHKELHAREESLILWARPYLEEFPELKWWEFAAATGSTLCTFALFSFSSYPKAQEELERIINAYFPWICSFHILLDYLIDIEEDEKGGDLNFVSCYQGLDERKEGLKRIFKRCLDFVPGLSDPSFHLAVLNGLLALYFSDPKANHPSVRPVCNRLLRTGGYLPKLFCQFCKGLRNLGII